MSLLDPKPELNVRTFELRRIAMPAAAFIAAATLLTTTVNAQTPSMPSLTVNGSAANAPQAERNNHIFVPAQSVFSQLGETVTFKSPLAIVKSKTGAELARMTLGSRDASMKGAAQTLAAAPFTAHGALMVPLRFVSEAAGATVAYSANPRTIDIRKAATVAAAAAPAVVAAAPAAQPTDAATTAPATAAVAEQSTGGIPWWVWLLAALLLLGLLLAFLRRKKEPVIVTSSKGHGGEPTITTRH